VKNPSTPAIQLLITCEHGGNRIPAAYRSLFRDSRELLDSHRGYDPGALVMAKQLASNLGGVLVASEVSRLLVDLNRSLGNPSIHGEAIRAASDWQRREIVESYYLPYRGEALRNVSAAVERGVGVVHISSHSFTPKLHGKLRNADIGLLYDPVRECEVRFCELWKKSLAMCAPDLKVRRNYPYAGKGDGLTRYFRAQFSPAEYVGIELEINQRHVFQAGTPWIALRKAVIESLRPLLANMQVWATASGSASCTGPATSKSRTAG
jgi:predicted N-formylglutamate amidohydrolase